MEAGSFTAAARQLRVAKSAVSRRISDLEARLGTPLLVRSTRSLSLTPDGELLFAKAKDLLEAWEEMEALARPGDGTLAGPVRLSAPLSFGVAHLGPVLTRFAAEHPAVRVDADFSDRRSDLVADGLDLAVRIGTLADSSLKARKLCDIDMIVAASPELVERLGVPETPEDLAKLGYRELRYSNRALAGWQFDKNGTAYEVTLEAALLSSNGDYLTQAAAAGLGVTIQPAFLTYRERRAGELVPLLSGYALEALGLYLLFPPNRHRPARVRALSDAVGEAFSGRPPWDADADADTPLPKDTS